MTHTRLTGRAHLRHNRLAIALFAITSVPAFAQVAPNGAADAKDFDTVVVTAAGFEQKITDAPASISVITREDLGKRPYMTLLDAVRDIEGVDVGETRDKTGQGTISMRGMGSDYTLILVNGKRQNNHGDIYPNNFGGNQFNHIPPLDAIERIEVIRGPASTLYGADAMGGVINIITKRSLDSWHGSASVARTFEASEFGDDATFDFFVTGPLVAGKLDLSARGSWYDRKASNPTYETLTDPSGREHPRPLGFGGGGKTVDNTNKAGGISLTWTPTDAQTVTLDYDTSRQQYDNGIKTNDSGVQEYPVGTVDNINSIWRVANVNGVTRVAPQVGYSPTQEFTRDAWSLTHEGKWGFGNSFVSLSNVATNNDGRTLPFTVAERNHLQQMWDGTGPYAGLTTAQRRDIAAQTFLPRPKRTLESAQYTLDAKLDIPYQLAGDHTALIGAQVIRGDLTDGVFGMESGTPSAVQKQDMYSLFAEDTWYVIAPLAITAGLRYDNHKVFGSQVSPRLYGVYTINERWTVKGGVSTGFKTPKTTQLYDGVTGFGGQGVSPMFGNPDLQPETSTSNELAVYWQHPGGHSFNATLFHNTFDDKIASQPCGPGTTLVCSSTGDYADLGYATSTKTVNIDEVVIKGAELAGRWKISTAFGFRANYTYTDSEQKSGAEVGLPLGNSARHMANATLDWQATEKFNVFLSVEARSKRYRGLHAITREQLYYKDYEVLHLGASFKATEWLTINARINNLLDRDFTTYDAEFRDLNGDGDYIDTNIGGSGRNEALFFDHYNNKDKARSLWLSFNVNF
ncbi:outer membrane receptor for ferrienterochelin and colicins [Pseudoxanthomonas japonensis]|uniref:TonB-dependent receptor domain-containing protein n=1 Tax=Pseudoxanthomonas TaxID=83618 RepID=UPI0007860F2F|nr:MULTISPECIES: TonB-dependent receptor [Pseudoxanthomonas]MBL8255334.1 TonB-dependent receptor [Pseudoxanthomonas mexicana]MDR7067762.1 outer membrane receptor for ferrienterochelin and colicins [Pseudoxanthomonas japonensis]